jgi:hypothetical protein
MTPKYYFGNYPNSASYDDNVPIGWNKWDAEEIEFEEIIDDENTIDNSNENDGENN